MSKILIVPLENFLGNFGLIGEILPDPSFIELDLTMIEEITKYKNEGWNVCAFGISFLEKSVLDFNPYFYESIDELMFLIDCLDLLMINFLSTDESIAHTKQKDNLIYDKELEDWWKTEIPYEPQDRGYLLPLFLQVIGTNILQEKDSTWKEKIAFISNSSTVTSFCAKNGLFSVTQDEFYNYKIHGIPATPWQSLGDDKADFLVDFLHPFNLLPF